MKRILIFCTLFLHIGLMYGQSQSNKLENEFNEVWEKRQTVINQIKEKSEDIGDLQHQFANEIAKRKLLLLERNDNGQYTIADSCDYASLNHYYFEKVMKHICEKGEYHSLEYGFTHIFDVKKNYAQNYYVLITDVEYGKFNDVIMSHIDSLHTEMVKLSEKRICYGSMLKKCKEKFENEEQKQVATEIVEEMRIANHPKYKKANKDLIKGIISKEIYDTLNALYDSCLASIYNVALKVCPKKIDGQEPAYFFKKIYDYYDNSNNHSYKYIDDVVDQGISYFIAEEMPKIKEEVKYVILNLIYSDGKFVNPMRLQYINDIRYFQSMYWDNFYAVGLVKVKNPYHRNTLYHSNRNDKNISELNKIDMEEQSKGFEWIYTSKSVEKEQNYPVPVTYLEFENHPEYRCIGNDNVSFIYNDQGELQRVTNLIRYLEGDRNNTYPRVPVIYEYNKDMSSFDELWRHVIKIAYDDNKYNIKSKGTEKTQKRIKAYITPPGLSKAGEEAAKALGQSILADYYYGENSKEAKFAKRNADLNFLAAAMEYYDEDAMNWMAQIRQDYLKDFEMPYEIKRIDNTTFDVIYVDENLKPKWKLTIKYYTAEPYVANRVTKLVEIK